MHYTKSQLMQIAIELRPDWTSVQFEESFAAATHLKDAFESLKLAGLTNEQANVVMCVAVRLIHEAKVS